jgi:hypothetical protein
MVEVDIDIESEIESAVEEAMANHEPDYDEIRCQIEDDILSQVDDHIDWSNAEYNLDIDGLVDSAIDYKDFIEEDDLADKIVEFVESGCDVVDGIALELLERAVKTQGGMTPRDFYLPTWDDWHELQAQVRALSQIIDTSSVRTSLADDIVNSYIAKDVNTETLMNTIANLRNERYQAIRYLSKPDLIAWAAENGFGDLSALKVTDIHKVIL